MALINEHISFGDRRLVGQQHAKQNIERILGSDRLGHAYLLTGPEGSGKTAFAIALAEIINGVDHLTDLRGSAVSKKSSWFTHPDIHLFIPIPSGTSSNEIQSRLELLAEDPYEIVNFKLRPALSDPESSKNLQAFYPIKYYHEEIRPKSVYKPNEGRKTVIIINEIDTMRKEAANAFLKLLEEPSGNIVFILTSSKPDQLLPTILSRCQQIRLKPLSMEEVTEGLVTYDHIKPEQASLLARLSGGNYSLARFLDLDSLVQMRDEIIRFLRYSYSQNAVELMSLINQWNRRLNRENQIALCNTIERTLHDILIYKESGYKELVINIDRIDVIEKFCQTMTDARLDEMIAHVQELKKRLYQNVQFKYIATVLAMRFSHLMRGLDPLIGKESTWKHLPALTEL